MVFYFLHRGTWYMTEAVEHMDSFWEAYCVLLMSSKFEKCWQSTCKMAKLINLRQAKQFKKKKNRYTYRTKGVKMCVTGKVLVGQLSREEKSFEKAWRK